MGLLTGEEEIVVKELARSYYESSIKNDKFDNPNRMFGIEVEFSIVDEEGNLCTGLAEKISRELSELPVVPELGSYQIEVNPAPIELKEGSFCQLHSNLRYITKQMKSIGERFDSLLFPIGIPLSKVDWPLQPAQSYSLKYSQLVQYPSIVSSIFLRLLRTSEL